MRRVKLSPRSRTTAAVAVLAILVVVLAFVRAKTAPSGTAPKVAVEPLVEPAVAETWTVAAVTVSRRGTRPFLFGRQDGQWRCLTHANAWVTEGAIDQLIADLLNAQVSPRGRTAEPARYGLTSVPELRIELHGPQVLAQPDRDVLFTLDVGDALSAQGTNFVRIPGRDGVLALELDLVERLASEPGQPPLIEKLLIPTAWDGRTRGVDQVLVERDGGTGIALARERLPAGPDGEEAWRWRLERLEGGGVRDAEEGLAGLYLTFLFRVEFERLLEARDVDPELALHPVARIQLFATGSEPPLELALLPPLADGRRVVLQAKDRLVLEITDEVAALLAATYEHLVDIETTPAWDRWLRVQLPPDLMQERR